MIGRLRGHGEILADGRLLIDVGGVGYVLRASLHCCETVAAAPERVEILVETTIHDDRIELFGFSSSAEARCFAELTRIQGIGARLALAILSQLRPNELAEAVATEDIGRLTLVSGLGKKLAQRLVHESGDRLEVFLTGAATSPDTGKGKAGDRLLVRQALEQMGLARQEAERVLTAARHGTEQDEITVDAWIRLALRELAR